MITKALFVIFVVFVQEIVSLNALLFATHQGTYSPTLIHILFVVATLVDIIIGFYVGKLLQKKTYQSKITNWIRNLSERFSLSTKKHKRWLVLLLLGNLSFPYINAVVAGYLDMPFWESMFFIFLGNITYYITLWLLVLGASSLTKNIYLAFAIVIAVIIVCFIIFRKLKVRFAKF